LSDSLPPQDDTHHASASNADGASAARINPVVMTGSAAGILLFALWALLFSEQATRVINAILAQISRGFGWFYFLSVLIFLVFVIGVAISRFGDIRLGPDDARPEFPLWSWAAMLFAAGIGIDLLFFSVSEPLFHFLMPLDQTPGTVEAARHAMELTFLHWGLSGWGVYTLVGMSLAFFCYRRGLPLTIRSALYPIFDRHINGIAGHTVDIAAVLGTVFGIATSLGIGIIQLNFGLNYMFGLPEGLVVQTSLALLIVFFSAVSAVTGVGRGIRRLSEFNMVLALLLVLFVLVSGKTIFLLNVMVTNIGDYLSDFLQLSTDTYAFDRPVDWLNAWTVFFWAWWIAWGPFVGLFLARISRGRTVREFVAGTLILPLCFMMVWMSVIGNSAIDLAMTGEAGSDFAAQAIDHPGSSIYLFLESLPWAGVTTFVVSILAIVFFVTSGDSGSLVLSNLTVQHPRIEGNGLRDRSRQPDPASWLRIFWAVVIGVLTLSLLLADGMSTLQGAVVVMGLPFAIVLYLMMIALFKSLKQEVRHE
jgi:choline/glycine/proline betaine transport protein